MKRREMYRTSAIALIAVCAFASPAMAETGDEPQAGVEDIIVTAQKTSQNVQTVPLAITALSGDFIEKSNIQDFNDLKSRTPGMLYTEFAPGQPRYYIRGIGTTSRSAGADPGVAVFVDDVYMGRPAMTSNDFVDLDRVEILRGPQGTLFGRNATGGAVSFFTRKPDDQFRLDMKATVGNYNNVGGSLLVSGPLSDTLSGKIGVSANGHSGYAFNETTNTDVEDSRFVSGRAALRWRPDSDWDIQLNVDGARRRGTAPWWDLATEGPTSKGKSNPDPRRGKNYADNGYANFNNFGVSLNSQWTSPIGTFASITAWRKYSAYNHVDTTGLNVLPLSDPNRNSGFHTLNIQEDDEDGNQFTQELRLVSDVTDRFRLTTGAFFIHSRTHHYKPTWYRYLAFAGGIEGSFFSDSTNRTNGYALYANGTYELTDKLSLEAGVRWSHDKKSQDITAGGIPSSPYTKNGIKIPGYTLNTSADWSAWTPTASLKYQLNSQFMLFGTVSRGFTSGGFQDSSQEYYGALLPFNPEHVWNYEAGFKSRWLDGRLQVNASAFLMRYTDMQVVVIKVVDPALPSIRVAGNAGKSTIKGIDLEVNAVPVPGWNLYGIYSYMDGKINEMIASNVNYAGKSLAQIPRNKFMIGTSVEKSISDYTFIARVDFSYQTSWYANITNLADERSGTQKSLDAGLTMKLPGDHWSLDLWGKNLTNELKINTVTDVRGDAFASYLPPRTYGATLKFRY